MDTTAMPVGMRFMEAVPDCPVSGAYSEERRMWLGGDGKPAIPSAVTVTGSNATTGASQETDVNEDYD